MTQSVANPFRVSTALLTLAIVLVAPSAATAQAVKLSPATMPVVGTVSERYQSYNIEMVEVTGGRFWAPYDAKTEDPAHAAQANPGGLAATAFRYRPPIDLGNARLRKMAAALGPAYVRVSGTWANSTYFQDSDAPAPATPPKGFNGVLTRQEWRGVIDFARAVNAQVVSSFAISAGVRDANGVWTPVEATKLLQYTKSIGGSIAAAEMFNEPTFASMGGAPQGYDAAAYGRDFRVFDAFVKKAAPKMIVLGPSSVAEVGALSAGFPNAQMLHSEDMLKAEGPGLDAFSYHFYGAVSKRCTMLGPASQTSPEEALAEEWLFRTDRDEAFYAALRDRFEPGKPMWLTETGEAACGGNPWASDFMDSFRYLNQLGTLARKGVKVVMQNTLASSDYALINGETMTPRPNYWSAVLWRRLMGTKVLDAGAATTPDLYVYAHCLRGHAGGVAVLAINASRTAARELALPASAERYSLTADNLMDSTVKLNGAELKLTAGGDLPAMAGAPEHAGNAALAAESITFFAIPEAQNKACR